MRHGLPRVGRELAALVLGEPLEMLQQLAGLDDQRRGQVLGRMERAPVTVIGELLQRATLPRKKARLDRDSMISVILAVCDGRYVRLSVLAELLSRNVDGLRKGYLDALVKDNRILRAFPGTPTHEMQSYRTAEVGSKGLHRS